MSKTKLRVRDVETEIPTVSPSLMPFRIAYSGPAPISTYFLTRPFIDADEKRRLAVGTALAGEWDNNAENRIDSGANSPTGVSERVQDALEEKKDALSGQPVGGPTKDQLEPGTNTRLSAAFRGRKVVSHNVVLPDGYTGLLLTSASTTKATIAEDTSREDVNAGKVGKRGNAKAKSAVVKAGDRAKALKAKAAAKKAGGKGGARRSRKVVEEDVEEDEGPVDGDELEPEDELVQLEGDAAENGEGVPGDPLVGDKVFEVAGQFHRFSLWHPDVPVDEARDEYTRSLKEWIGLASEIHRI